MTSDRYLAASLACACAAGLVGGLRGLALHRADAIALRELDQLRNQLATIERMIEADRRETRNGEPIDPAKWGGGQWASPELPLGETA